MKRNPGGRAPWRAVSALRQGLRLVGRASIAPATMAYAHGVSDSVPTRVVMGSRVRHPGPGSARGSRGQSASFEIPDGVPDTGQKYTRTAIVNIFSPRGGTSFNVQMDMVLTVNR